MTRPIRPPAPGQAAAGFNVHDPGFHSALLTYAPVNAKHTRIGSESSRSGCAPDAINLRIIDYQIPGFRASAVVTNVLDPKQISRDEWVRLATQSVSGRRLQPGLYHRRWEIETTFHELKVRQGMEGGLRSLTPAGIAYEVAGHVLL